MQPKPSKPLEDVVKETKYPMEAFEFIRDGLNHAVKQVHKDKDLPSGKRHVSGAQLCEALRSLALDKWGLLAGTVLQRWNVTGTHDFGAIVFALVENDYLQKTEEDDISDFENVFDFEKAFNVGITFKDSTD